MAAVRHARRVEPAQNSPRARAQTTSTHAGRYSGRNAVSRAVGRPRTPVASVDGPLADRSVRRRGCSSSIEALQDPGGSAKRALERRLIGARSQTPVATMAAGGLPRPRRRSDHPRVRAWPPTRPPRERSLEVHQTSERAPTAASGLQLRRRDRRDVAFESLSSALPAERSRARGRPCGALPGCELIVKQRSRAGTRAWPLGCA
jgi:hypothetical protein